MAKGDKGIEIDFLANERDFVRGAGNVEESLGKIGGSLDDLARDTGTSTERMADDVRDLGKDAERSLEGIAKEGDQQLEKLEKSFREMADTATRESRSAGEATSHEIKRGAAEAGEGVRTLKDESRQNAEEIASSFDGSAQSIADGFQGIAATALSGFGPAGAAAGLAVAAGIGLASTAMQAGTDDTEAFRQKVADLGDQFIESAGQGTRSVQTMADDMRALATATDDGQTNLADLDKIARGLNLPLKDVVSGYLEGGTRLDVMIRKNAALMQAENDRLNAATQASGDAAAAYSPELKALQDRADLLGEQKRALEQGREAEERWLRSGGAELEQKASAESAYIDQLEANTEREKTALEDAATAHANAVASIDASYDAAAGAAQTYIDAESGLFDTKKYITAMQEKQKALEEYQKNLAESPLTPEAKAFLESQGADSAATFLAGYKKATPEQQAELNRIWTEAGKTGSATYASTLQSNMPGTVNGPRVILSQSGLDELEDRLGTMARRKYEIEIGVRYPNGKPVLP